MSSIKRCSEKFRNICRKISGVSLKKGYWPSAYHFIKKETPTPTYNPCEFCSYAPITILVNDSNTGYQKEFALFSFLRSPYGKFVDICMENFIKVFYQSFSCALFLSTFWSLTNIQLSSKLPFPQYKCLMLKNWRHRVISVKKKISCKSYLKLYLILIHHQTKLCGFFIFRKENGINSYFYITTKNQLFHEPTLNFPG